MAEAKIGVGIVGLSSRGGWAQAAHLPALRANDGFALRAFSGSSAASAARSAAELGIAAACGSAEALAARDDVDLVVVSVKVPDHAEAVRVALDRGKHVYCEWPLARNLAEAEELTARTAISRGTGFVGLQARSSPTLLFLRDLIAQGAIGEILSTTLVGSGGSWGEDFPSGGAYLLDPSNGATMTTIPFGHGIDALCTMLGAFARFDALEAIRRPLAREQGTGMLIARKAADQVVLHGVLQSGAVAAVHYRGGLCGATNLLWEINGTEGDIRITGDTGHVQFAELSVEIHRKGTAGLAPLETPLRYRRTRPTGNARVDNLSEAYARLLDDIRHGTADVPRFADALSLHRMLAVIA